MNPLFPFRSEGSLRPHGDPFRPDRGGSNNVVKMAHLSIMNASRCQSRTGQFSPAGRQKEIAFSPIIFYL
jgi:hypothetical protein